jgi:cyclase
MKAPVFAAAAALCLSIPALAQEGGFQTTDLGGGVFMIANDRAGNVGVLVNAGGVLMIDTQMAPFAEDLAEAVREASGGRDPELVINTHLHGDHVLGNEYFAGLGAVILAHETVPERLANPTRSELTGSMPEPLSGAFLPVETVSGDASLADRGFRAEIRHAPAAHTDGDLWIVFPEADVIHTGDLLFSGRYPFIDLDNGGTVQGYIDALEAIAEAAGPQTRVIPGHGPLSSREDLLASRDMLIEARSRVQALVDEGRDLEAIQAEAPLADLDPDWSWRFIDADRMVFTLYRDITGETR